MTEDRLVQAAADRLLPPETPDFFDEFWRKAQEREHLAARRWRRVSLALAAALLTAVAAAGVIAAPLVSNDVVDETITCSTLTQGSLHVFDIGGGTTRPKTVTFRQTAQLIVSTGGDTYWGAKLLAFDESLKGFVQNKNLCTTSHRRVALTRGTLPLRGESRRGMYGGHELRCLRPGAVALHYRITFGSNGTAAKAQVALQMAATGKPVAYVDWSPSLMRMYGLESCKDEGF